MFVYRRSLALCPADQNLLILDGTDVFSKTGCLLVSDERSKVGDGNIEADVPLKSGG
jgi:hypothetical protein